MKKISIAPKPSRSSSGRSSDDWVENQLATPAIEPTKRLTIDVSLTLHKRIKTGCAVEELVMADVIRELLSKRFPEGKSSGNASS